MNDRCAAGTGRFLEVVAERLEVPLEHLGALAQSGGLPVGPHDWQPNGPQAVQVADGVVMGASVMRRLLDGGAEAAGDFIAEVRAAIDG